MVDPHTTIVFVRNKEDGRLQQRGVTSIRHDGSYIHLGRADGTGEYKNHSSNVFISHVQQRTTVDSSTRVEVNGEPWQNATEVVDYPEPDGMWARVFYKTTRGEQFSDRPASEVSVHLDAADTPLGDSLMSYWRSLVGSMPDDDPLRYAYQSLDFVDQDSTLGRIFTKTTIDCREWDNPLIFPFSCNGSQRRAIESALQSSISVIDGPPGTGKTQTILNIIANIITFDPTATIGIVSSNNAAVENVRSKLAAEGLDFIVAALGRREKRELFFSQQKERNGTLGQFLSGNLPDAPTMHEFATLDERRRRLDDTKLRQATLRGELQAYRLEQRHFLDFLEHQQIPEFSSVPLFRRSSDTLIDYLVSTELVPDDEGVAARIIRKIITYLKFGSLRDTSPDDTDFILRVQTLFYERRIEELEAELSATTAALTRENYEAVSENHRLSSRALFHAALRDRYAEHTPYRHDGQDYRKNASNFARFVRDYPVILSTCHSLRNSISPNHLLDYLVIDEASQLDLPTAALALASCRTAIVVGDVLQLRPVINADAAKAAGPAPHDCFDYATQSALSSLIEFYGGNLPRTMLKEHYRCDPAIIGFCNSKFYDGQLIPFTQGSDPAPLVVYRTVEGNHQRAHGNVREVEVLTHEVIPRLLEHYDLEKIGTTTPYRQQAGLVDEFINAIHGACGIETDTVHKYQGREKDVMIMSTVLSENRHGHMGLRFVDDPHLVNVAVSRAVKKFVIVTNHDQLPRSRNLRDLIDYIDYQYPGAGTVDSEIVSMFDLLYQEFSRRLLPFATRVRGKSKYLSENIVWTRLGEMLAEPRYRDLRFAPQVRLRDTFRDLSGLTDEQVNYIKHKASFDFVVYFRAGNRQSFAVEVDGYHFHQNRPDQERRDALKDAICRTKGLPLLRLPTWHSDGEARLRSCLEASVTGEEFPF